MPTVTLLPDSDVAGGSFTVVGAQSTRWESLNNGVATPVDADKLTASAGTDSVTLENLPAGAGDVTAATITSRHSTFATKDGDRFHYARIYDSGGTALTNQVTIPYSATTTNYTIAFTVTDGTASKWNDAKVTFSLGGSTGVLSLYEVEVDATYTAPMSWTAYRWLPLIGLWKRPPAGMTVTGGNAVLAVNKGDASPSTSSSITFADITSELWFNFDTLPPDYLSAHHFNFRLTGQRTDDTLGTGTPAQYLMQLFEADGVTALTDEQLLGSFLDGVFVDRSVDDVPPIGDDSRASLRNAKVRLRQFHNGGDFAEIAAVTVWVTYNPIEVKTYTCKPVGDGTNDNYNSSEPTFYEAVHHGIDTPDDAELLQLTDEAGDVFLVMGPDPPADFYQPIHLQSEARVKISTVAGDKHNTSVGHYEADETSQMPGGNGNAAAPNAGSWFIQDHPVEKDTNSQGDFSDWSEHVQESPHGGGNDRDALTGWRLKIGSSGTNGDHFVSEIETEVQYSALPALSTVAFERLYPATDHTVSGAVASTEATYWEAINTRVQLADDAKFITFPDADSHVFFGLSTLPSDLDSVHHFTAWCRYQRTLTTGDHSDLFLQLFEADELTPLTDEFLINKSVNINIGWEQHGELDVPPLATLNRATLATARVRLRQDYRGDSAMKVSAFHLETNYHPAEVREVVIKPAGDGTNSGFTSSESTFFDAVDAGVSTPDDAKLLTLDTAAGDTSLIMGPEPPRDLFQVCAVQARMRAKVSTLTGSPVPLLELQRSTGSMAISETLTLDSDITATWGDHATLATDNATAVTIGNNQTDANIFGTTDATKIYREKSIHTVTFRAKGEATGGFIGLNVRLKINDVLTTVETLTFTGGVQTLSDSWAAGTWDADHFDALEVEIWFDGLGPADEFEFEFCDVTIDGTTYAGGAQLTPTVLPVPTESAAFVDLVQDIPQAVVSSGYFTTMSRSHAADGLTAVDRDAFLFPVAELSTLWDAGVLTISEVEISLWISALNNSAAGQYLLRLLQEAKPMIRNTANQRWLVYAFNRSTGDPETGDALNISANLYQNAGGAVAVGDTNPTELSGGFYAFDLTATETAAHTLALIPTSTTTNVSVVPCPAVIATNPPNYELLGIESDGDLTKVNTLNGHTAQTADHTAALTAQDVILGNLPNAGALTDLATIKDRIGAFAGSGVNTILGFLRALGSKAATTPSELVDGNTYSAADDSLEAIRDRGDTNWFTTSTGLGANVVTITIQDAADNSALQNARVRLVEGATNLISETNASGQVVFGADSATYTYVATKAGYGQTSGTLVVDGTENVTYQLTLTSAASPSPPGTATGRLVLYNESHVVEASKPVTIKLIKGSGLAGIGRDQAERTVNSDINGLVEFTGLGHGCLYSIRRGDTQQSANSFGTRSTAPGTFLVPDGASSFDIAEVLGVDAA